ncbi:MAG: hypothetical protein Q4B73_06010 [Lachnospiraceae bacterium]|nr:hypothetical protein [Lachnospiraceae bacterium]
MMRKTKSCADIRMTSTRFARSGRLMTVIMAVLLLSLTLLTGCGASDNPPPAEMPEPPAHDGTYVADCGTLIFNGDGESITVTFDDDFAAAADLPTGTCEGTYVFTFHNGRYRYDKAEAFEIFLGDETCRFNNHWQETTEERIVLVSPLDAAETLIFERQ